MVGLAERGVDAVRFSASPAATAQTLLVRLASSWCTAIRAPAGTGGTLARYGLSWRQQAG